MFRNLGLFSKQQKDDPEERESLLAEEREKNKKVKVRELSTSDHQATINPEQKTYDDYKKEDKDEEVVIDANQVPRKRYHSLKERDPLRFGLFPEILPYCDSILGYAGFNINMPRVFLPESNSESNNRKTKL